LTNKFSPFQINFSNQKWLLTHKIIRKIWSSILIKIWWFKVNLLRVKIPSNKAKKPIPVADISMNAINTNWQRKDTRCMMNPNAQIMLEYIHSRRFYKLIRYAASILISSLQIKFCHKTSWTSTKSKKNGLYRYKVARNSRKCWPF